MLITACGATKTARAPGTMSSRSAAYQTQLAYANCMHAHGLKSFPNPSRSTSIDVSTQLHAKPGSPAARALKACEPLLRKGSTTPSSTRERPGVVTGDCLTPGDCYAPRQFRVTYGIQPLLNRGITGRGRTVVLLEFPPSASSNAGRVVTDVRQDVTRFDRLFELPAARLQIVNTLAHVSSPWRATLEEVQDTEIVHAIAPEATIREVLIPSSIAASPNRVSAAVLAALRLGVSQGSVISFSGGAGEQCFAPTVASRVNSVLQAAQRAKVTVVISTGDSGAATTACPPATGSSAVKGVDLPASDPLALAVGGTTLHANAHTGAHLSETTWSSPTGAGGGGYSRLFPEPAYQHGIPDLRAARAVPDVAADANPDTGLALTLSDGGRREIFSASGVSAAAPLWAAVIALADQYAGRNLGFLNPALYRIGRSTHYHQAFHDITAGTNTVTLGPHIITGYRATPRWDPVTGWGSPNAQALVPLLARYASP